MGIRFYSFYPGRANRLRFKKCLGIVWWMTWRIVVLASFIMLINKACIGVQCSKPIVTPTDSVNVATTFQDSVYGAIYALRIQHPDIVMAQCIEESGHFTSRLFVDGHNCTGMKVPSTRPTLAVGVLYGHACFNSWYECLVDYALWQTAFARNLSRDEYFAYLDRVYAEKKNYSQRIKTIIKTKGL